MTTPPLSDEQLAELVERRAACPESAPMHRHGCLCVQCEDRERFLRSAVAYVPRLVAEVQAFREEQAYEQAQGDALARMMPLGGSDPAG
jgi:hypothetical protein